jgi:hypothetical protein
MIKRSIAESGKKRYILCHRGTRPLSIICIEIDNNYFDNYDIIEILK